MLKISEHTRYAQNAVSLKINKIYSKYENLLTREGLDLLCAAIATDPAMTN